MRGRKQKVSFLRDFGKKKGRVFSDALLCLKCQEMVTVSNYCRFENIKGNYKCHSGLQVVVEMALESSRKAR